MKRYSFQPREELRGILKTIEILDIPDAEKAGIGNRFLPDGFFEIGFNLGSDDLKVTSTSVNHIQLDNPVGYFYGQCNVSSQMFTAGRLHIMIVKIYPWAASLFFDFDLSDCIDCNLNLDLVFGKEIQLLEEKMMEARHYKNQIKILQDYLVLKLKQGNNSHNYLLQEATWLLFQSKGKIRMKDLAAKMHSTPRTLQRIFSQHYGITPKKYAQQLRLRHFASLLSQNNNTNLTELALLCGYFDQAHFNHEFRSIVQTTPTQFFIDNIPLVDGFLKYS